MFKFNNISSKAMKVICEEEDNLLAKAAINYEETIAGKYNFNGYLNIDGELKLYVLDLDKLDDIFSWLNGTGILEYKNKITTISFLDTIKPVRSSSIKIIEISFKRDPFWYKKNDEYVLVDSSVLNEGNIYSNPTIKLVKNSASKIDITINGTRFSYTFPDNEEYVEIDCEDCNAYFDGLYRNNNLEIDFTFPKLDPGNNSVIINSGNAIIYMKKKDRWL